MSDYGITKASEVDREVVVAAIKVCGVKLLCSVQNGIASTQR